MSNRSTRKFTGRKAIAAALIVIASVPIATLRAQAPDGVTVEQLRAELAQRDAVIIDLLNRVRALEQQRGDGDAEPPRGTGDSAAPRPRGAATAAADGAGAVDDAEIDELVAERALERSLVQEGARLLPRSQVEFAPRFVLSHDEGMFPTALMIAGGSVVGEVARTFDIYETSADLRIGLPRDFQLDIGLPYRVVKQQSETGIDGAVQSIADQTGSGYGDASIGLAKAFAPGASSTTNLIGQLAWLTGSGSERDGPVYIGGGNAGLAARLTANWRRDPVVFLAGGGYTYYRRNGMIQLGDSFELSLGLGLAVSPETALIFSLDQSSVSELKRDGLELAGTDRLSSTFRLSASTILGRRLSLRANAGIGLTEDAPDFQFGVTLSSRFQTR